MSIDATITGAAGRCMCAPSCTEFDGPLFWFYQDRSCGGLSFSGCGLRIGAPYCFASGKNVFLKVLDELALGLRIQARAYIADMAVRCDGKRTLDELRVAELLASAKIMAKRSQIIVAFRTDVPVCLGKTSYCIFTLSDLAILSRFFRWTDVFNVLKPLL
jgi:hypothetical protein